MGLQNEMRKRKFHSSLHLKINVDHFSIEQQSLKQIYLSDLN